MFCIFSQVKVDFRSERIALVWVSSKLLTLALPMVSNHIEGGRIEGGQAVDQVYLLILEVRY